MVIKLILVLSAIVAGILIYAGLKNPQMQISREISIKATPEKLFSYINNSQKMNDWMPWKDSDPEVIITYAGPAEGVGSKSIWDSKGKMGTGTAEIVQSISNQEVKTKLEYTKPMNMSQLAQVKLTLGNDGETIVRWSVNCHNNFFFRLVGIFWSADKMVGDEFAKGLIKLKKLAEQEK